MMGVKKTIRAVVVATVTTLLLTLLSVNIQGYTDCLSSYLPEMNERDSQSHGLASNVIIEPVTYPLWFQIVAFPWTLPLYDLVTKNYNNRSIDCYVKQELTDKQGKILITYNESYTLQPYKPPYPPRNPVDTIWKRDLMEKHFQLGVFNVYVELFVPEDGSRNNASFSGFYFHWFSWLFGLQYYFNFYGL